MARPTTQADRCSHKVQRLFWLHAFGADSKKNFSDWEEESLERRVEEREWKKRSNSKHRGK